jgi:hypothetical protein
MSSDVALALSDCRIAVKEVSLRCVSIRDQLVVLFFTLITLLVSWFLGTLQLVEAALRLLQQCASAITVVRREAVRFSISDEYDLLDGPVVDVVSGAEVCGVVAAPRAITKLPTAPVGVATFAVETYPLAGKGCRTPSPVRQNVPAFPVSFADVSDDHVHGAKHQGCRTPSPGRQNVPAFLSADSDVFSGEPASAVVHVFGCAVVDTLDVPVVEESDGSAGLATQSSKGQEVASPALVTGGATLVVEGALLTTASLGGGMTSVRSPPEAMADSESCVSRECPSVCLSNSSENPDMKRVFLANAFCATKDRSRGPPPPRFGELRGPSKPVLQAVPPCICEEGVSNSDECGESITTLDECGDSITTLAGSAWHVNDSGDSRNWADMSQVIGHSCSDRVPRVAGKNKKNVRRAAKRSAATAAAAAEVWLSVLLCDLNAALEDQLAQEHDSLVTPLIACVYASSHKVRVLSDAMYVVLKRQINSLGEVQALGYVLVPRLQEIILRVQ